RSGCASPSTAGTSTRWPSLDMGRNSVAPWIIPMRIASSRDLMNYELRITNYESRGTPLLPFSPAPFHLFPHRIMTEKLMRKVCHRSLANRLSQVVHEAQQEVEVVGRQQDRGQYLVGLHQ